MQPEPFAPRFITTDYGCRFRQTQAALSLGDFVEHALLLTCGHGTLARLLTRANGEAELPGFFTQFEGHKQDRLSCAIMRVGGRCGDHELSPPGGQVEG